MTYNQKIIRQKAGIAFILFVIVLKVQAYDFEVNGIYYNITAKNEVEVTHGTDTFNTYSGKIVIPRTIQNGSKKYNVTRVGSCAFIDCKNLNSVIIPNGVTSIGYAAFGDSGISFITISNSVKIIGPHAFALCQNLTSIVIPEGVKRIENAVFSGCSNLVSVTLPNSVSYIGNVVFFQCKKLEYIAIPKNISDFESCSLFLQCESLKHIKVPWNIPPKVIVTFNEMNISQCTLLVPKGCKLNYLQAEVWKDFGTIEEYNTRKR